MTSPEVWSGSAPAPPAGLGVPGDFYVSGVSVYANTSGRWQPATRTVRHVTDFGAKGDGTTDDTAAIAAAVAWLGADGGTLLYGPASRRYNVSSIRLTNGARHIGGGATVVAISGAPQGIFEAEGWYTPGLYVSDSLVDGFILDANGIAHRGVFLYQASTCHVTNNRLINAGTGTDSGIRLHFNTTSCVVSANTITMGLDQPMGTVPSGIGVCCVSATSDLQAGGQNDTLAFGAASSLSSGHLIYGNTIYDGTHGVGLIGAADCRVTENYIQGQTHRGILMSPVALRNVIAANRLVDFGSTGIHLAWGSCSNVIIGNNLSTTASDIEGNAIKGYYGCSDNAVTGNICEGTLNGAIRFAMGSARNNVTGNRISDAGIGVQIQSYMPDTGYYQPASPPDADSNTIHANLITGCPTGVSLEANGPAAVINTMLGGNAVQGSSTAYAFLESVGLVADVTATGNTAVGASAVWVLPRGEQHFLQTAANTGLGGTPRSAPLRPGFYYQCTPSMSVSTALLGNDVLRVTPFQVPNGVTVANIGVEITSAGSAGCTVRIGIYADDAAGFPGALVLDAGTVPGDAVGVAELACTQSLGPGTYWVGAVVQGEPATQPALRALTSASGVAVAGVALSSGTTPGAAAAPTFAYAQTNIPGALPTAWASAAAPTQTAARVFVQIA